MQRMGIGLQLYTVRDDMTGDVAGTLRQVAAIGYEGVEFAGYFGTPAKEVRQLLDETGLRAIGAHVGLGNLRTNLQGEIEYMQTIGGRYIVCPGVPLEERQTADDWKRLFAFFQQTGEEVRKHGLQFGYHNHAFEFELHVDGAYAFDALYASTDAAAVQVEMDAGWVQRSGQDPLAYIRRYAGRLPLLHLKDFRSVGDKGIETPELGEGEVDLQAVIAAAGEAGVEWLIVEQDNCAKPPLTSVAISFDWLKSRYPLANGGITP